MAIIKQETNVQAKQALERALKDLADRTLKVGYFAQSKYEDGTPVAYIAAIQEFGSPQNNIPARPTMRPTEKEKQGEWRDIAARGARAVVRGSYTATQVMGQIGESASGDIRQAISQLTSPPLKPATVAARMRRKADRKTVGSLTKPLIDTGQMLASVSYEVE